MSLWTPGGNNGGGIGDRPDPSASGAATAPGFGQPKLSAEQEAEAHQIASEMQEVRDQLSQVPAAVVVANHAMGCYELAAIHLSHQPPRLSEAQLAVDAFGALLGAVEGRLGPDEATLNDALAQIRLAFVQVKAAWKDRETEASTSPNAADLA